MSVKIHKLHQGYLLKKGCPPVTDISYISGTLGDTGAPRHKAEPVPRHSPLISKLVQQNKIKNTHIHTWTFVSLRVKCYKSEEENV